MTVNCALDPRNLTRIVSALTQTVPGIAGSASPKQSGHLAGYLNTTQPTLTTLQWRVSQLLLLILV